MTSEDQKAQNSTTETDTDWVEAVERADSDTLIGIRRQEDERRAQYQAYADHFRWKCRVVTDELVRRGHE